MLAAAACFPSSHSSTALVGGRRPSLPLSVASFRWASSRRPRLSCSVSTSYTKVLSLLPFLLKLTDLLQRSLVVVGGETQWVVVKKSHSGGGMESLVGVELGESHSEWGGIEKLLALFQEVIEGQRVVRRKGTNEIGLGTFGPGLTRMILGILEIGEAIERDNEKRECSGALKSTGGLRMHEAVEGGREKVGREDMRRMSCGWAVGDESWEPAMTMTDLSAFPYAVTVHLDLGGHPLRSLTLSPPPLCGPRSGDSSSLGQADRYSGNFRILVITDSPPRDASSAAGCSDLGIWAPLPVVVVGREVDASSRLTSCWQMMLAEKAERCCRMVLNAAMLYWPMPNVLYVEGYALDRFAEGLWALQPVHQNKIGLIFDAGMEEELRIRHLQVADAARASLGLPLMEYIVTDSPLEVEKWIDPFCGKSTGRIQHPDSLLRAVHTLVSKSLVNAVAVVGRFPDDDEGTEDYRQGKVIFFV
ncbi:hypothetical protein ZIOFF_071719 [Zingiber officinale]|uniref:Uncharacterized protein n=1 Tax=Zingiber officinale TaxID=94328 RepID=A0A8J5EBM7_ZINOF|nr:hypothetical protein ZIOFF_071719 [Zingiber officinale]